MKHGFRQEDSTPNFVILPMRSHRHIVRCLYVDDKFELFTKTGSAAAALRLHLTHWT